MQQELNSGITGEPDKVARLERFLTQFSNDLARLEKERSTIEEHFPRITLEVEALKTIQKNFIPVLSDAVKKALKEEGRDFSKKAAEDLKNNVESSLKECRSQANDIHQKYLEDAHKFKQAIENTTHTLKRLMNLQKQRLTYRGLLICGVFCLASLLTGGGLFYFFPQHVYHPDKNIPKYLVMGKIVRDNFTKLSREDKGLILKEMEKYVRQ